MYHKEKEKTIPCRLCGALTSMLGTKLCHRCWELETKIEIDFTLALKIIKQIIRRRKEELPNQKEKKNVS